MISGYPAAHAELPADRSHHRLKRLRQHVLRDREGVHERERGNETGTKCVCVRESEREQERGSEREREKNRIGLWPPPTRTTLTARRAGGVGAGVAPKHLRGFHV